MDHSSNAVIESLREAGYEVFDSAPGPDGMRYGVRSKDNSAWVKGGQEMADLAAGRVTLKELADRRTAEEKWG
jgi:hypothetical protein